MESIFLLLDARFGLRGHAMHINTTRALAAESKDAFATVEEHYRN